MSTMIAMYRLSANGHRYALYAGYGGHLFREDLDYQGMFQDGAFKDMTPFSVDLLKGHYDVGLVDWLKTPGALYHVWHICCCDKCCPPISGSPFGDVSGGRVWDHSRAAWDEHLRYAPNDRIYTFPTVKEVSA